MARLAGALAVLDEQRYDTIVCNADTPEQRDHHLAALTARHRADGVIVVSIPLARHRLAAFRRGAIPLVTVDAVAAGVPQTIIDDVAGGRLATGHLLSLGHRRIGFVGTAAAGPRSARRPSARIRSRTRAAPRPAPGWRDTGGSSPGRASTLTLTWSGSGRTARRWRPSSPISCCALPDPPTAIFAVSDAQAMGVLSAAEHRGFPVPGRLSVVGFDDIESAALLKLSTVHQPLEQSGAEGARRLCALLRGARVRPLRQLLPLRIVQRASSAAPGRGAGPGPGLAAPGSRASRRQPGPGAGPDRSRSRRGLGRRQNEPRTVRPARGADGTAVMARQPRFLCPGRMPAEVVA